MAGYFVLSLCFLLVDGVFSADIVKESVKDGRSVTLRIDNTKQPNEMMLWYFNNIRIALINDPTTSCLYDGVGGTFSDRLEVDYETGSLTITETRPEHAGRYEAEIIRRDGSGKSESLNRPSKCDSTRITQKTNNLGETIKTFQVTVSGPFKMQQDSGMNSGLSLGVVAEHVLLLFFCWLLLL
uniref:Si:dkey-19a16.1 n=1 Tax=Cyprinus carpio carpio TaxID=630221 RepID=A0A9J8BH76_CYPCA